MPAELQQTPTPTPRDYVNYHTDYDTVRKSLFLGPELGLLENLRNEFPLVWEKYKHLKGLDWEETEMNIDSCKVEFATLPVEIVDLMINTLAFQFEADTSAAHIGRLMYPFVNNTELTVYLIELSKNECLHTLSYKFIVESSFDNPQLFIKRVMSIQESFQRLEKVKSVFTEIFKLGLRYQMGEDIPESTLRKAILKFWVTLYCLERIQFISSFAITFGLAEKGFFIPIAKLVQKIATDEFQIHVQVDKIILKNELAIPEIFSMYLEILPEIEEIVQEVENAEITWLRGFLFKEKSVIAGIQCEKIEQFVIYSAGEVYNFFGLKSPHGQILENPLPYMNKWLLIDSNQASPQEENVLNYLLGRFQDDRELHDAQGWRDKFASSGHLV